jgi:hypothetical protein
LVPHPPQLFGSTDTFKHAPLQLMAPAWHAQLPATHALPTAQEVPHLPQFALLLSSATHVPSHCSCPAAHAVRGDVVEALLHASGSASAKIKTRSKP